MYDLFTKPNPSYVPGAGDFIEKGGKKVRNVPRVFSWKKTLRNILIVILILIAAIVVYAAVVISDAPKIDPSKINDRISAASYVYDDAGKLIGSPNAGEHRDLVTYSELPKNLTNAVIVLEDRNFMRHHGISWWRIGGAVVDSVVRRQAISGTSTITQQLARNVYLPDTKSQRTLKRKITEMYYAHEIENKLSKKEIITAYLNSVYFGFGNYGVGSASKTYFSKSVSELDLTECAALAALPQAPDTYALLSPAGNGENGGSGENVITVNNKNYVLNDLSKDRRDMCLDLMKKKGYITDEEYKEAHGRSLGDLINPDLGFESDNFSSDFRDYVADQVIRDLVKKRKMSYSDARDLVYNGGLEIHSTLDSNAQAIIEREFSNPNNFPGLVDFRTDAEGNYIGEDGTVLLYAYPNMIDPDGRFTFRKGEFSYNDKGDLEILRGHRLVYYERGSSKAKEYSLEFKPSYVIEGGELYIYPGGTISVPHKYEHINKAGDLVISHEFLKHSGGAFIKDKDSPAFTAQACTMQTKVIQPQGAMVITDIRTGDIKAMAGGRGLPSEQGQFNRAINPRQPGSAIKPLTVYTAALQKSADYQKANKKFKYKDPKNDTQGTQYYGDYLTPSSIIVDEPITVNGAVWPQNSYDGYLGPMTMKEALALSVNVAAVKLYEQTGPKRCYDQLRKFGVTTAQKDGENNDMNPGALALGGLSRGIAPLQMAAAYAAFSGEGSRADTHPYTEVKDRNGKVLLRSEVKKHKVMDLSVAHEMCDMLEAVVTEGTGRKARIPNRYVAGKTGTTSNNYDIWFAGFTPPYSASLWIGTDVNVPLTSSSEAAAKLWGKIMGQISKDETGSYSRPPQELPEQFYNYPGLG